MVYLTNGLSSFFATAVLFLAAASAGPPLHAQAGSNWRPPGDIAGLWDFATATPLERPSEHADKEYLSVEEAAQFERLAIERLAQRQEDRPTVHAPDWLDYGRNVQGSRRTSLIFDPPNGRIPPMTEDARRLLQEVRDRRARPPAGPEDRSLWERCLIGFNAGPPINPGAYNNNVLIVVTPDTVALLNEMVHDTRIVPLDDRPRLPEHVRQFQGDSRGYWDGETLVIETRNFDPRVNFPGSGSNMHLAVVTERFTRFDDDTLVYEYTIDDPASFERPWSARIEMKKSDQAIFEYACHEGNYSLLNMLEYARTDEERANEAPAE